MDGVFLGLAGLLLGKPRPSLLWINPVKIEIIAETATLRTKWCVWKDKIMLVRRLQQQDSSSLSRRDPAEAGSARFGQGGICNM